MSRPKRFMSLEGNELILFADAVREEFLARDRFDNIPVGPRRINTIKTVSAELYGSLSPEARIAVMRHLLERNEEFYIEREPEEIFSTDSAVGILDERDRRTDF